MGRILIIDDNVDAADTLASILELSGHESHAAHGPIAGLAALPEFDPDVVLLDLGMPVMDGFAVAAAVRANRLLRQPFLIAFTAWNDAECIARTQSSGFDLHLTKPSSLEAVLSSIESARFHKRRD